MMTSLKARWLVFSLVLAIACLGPAQAKPDKDNKKNRGANSAWRKADRALSRRIAELEALLEAVASEQEVTELRNRVQSLEDLVNQQHALMQAMLGCVHPDSNSLDLILDGCNLHLRNGSGMSDSDNSLGNLIIGYNEDSGGGISRIGSHNLVIGPEHNYSGNNGIVAGSGDTRIEMDPSAGGLTLSGVSIEMLSIDDLAINSDQGDLSIDAASGEATLTAGQSILLETGSTEIEMSASDISMSSLNVEVEALIELDLKAGANATLEAGATADVSGSLVRLNNGSKQAARLGDAVSTPNNISGAINAGSSTVLIGD